MFLPIGDDNSQRLRIPYVKLMLIGLNVLAFVTELAAHAAGGLEAFVGHWSVIPLDYTAGAGYGGPVPWTLVTSMFLHGGWGHLLSNMLYLWIFGDNVESALGHVRYLLFYLLAGIAGAGAHILASPASTVPTLGASAAISGVLAGYLVLFPGNRVLVWFFFNVIAVPALLVIGLWAAMQFLSGAGSLLTAHEGGGVAYVAHVGGFLAGLLLTFILRPRGKRPEPLIDTVP